MTRQNRVAVLDAGGQYVDLVRKAVERQGIPADVLPLKTPLKEIEPKYGAIIISGSPASSHAEAAPQPDKAIWGSTLPILGICYGMQAMVTALGGQVIKNAIREDGRVITNIDNQHPLFKDLKKEFTALFTHGDFVKSLPKGFITLGSHTAPDGSIAYSAIAKANKLGVQFHPEVFDDTPGGYQLIKNFLKLIADLSPDKKFRDRQLQQLIKDKQEQIKKQAKDNHVIAFVSGGVDSSVAATLAAKVIDSSRLHAFYIDNGFMRYEDEEVVESLNKAGLKVVKVDATEDFENGTISIGGKTHGPLIGVTDPEQKRKIIGKVFVDIQNRLISSLNLPHALLLQGTNAADRIESGHSKGDFNTMTIKTHHNQVREVQELKKQGRLIEPIDDLFKDEIRQIGRQLGLPKELVNRQPFPGPGLAIRIICADKAEPDVTISGQDKEVADFIRTKTGDKVFGRLLPLRSVGVGGDERSHLSVVAVSGNNLSANKLAELGSNLPSNFRKTTNRVIYALSDQAIENCSQTVTLLSSDVRSELRQADKIVFEEMRASNLLEKIDQFPVIILPLSFGGLGKRSIVLRPVITSTFMTVQAMLPGRDLPSLFLQKVTDRIISEVAEISQVFLDVTNKPPATTEWE